MKTEIEKLEEIFKKRTDNNLRLKKTLQADNSIFQDKIRENEEIRTKLNFLKMELMSKKSILEKNNQTLEALKDREEKIKISVIFL